MNDFTQARTAMVDCQVRPSDVTRYDVIEAMLTVPREEFVPAGYRDVAYAGEHVPISDGRVLLDPRVTAKMLDVAEIGPKDLVLVVGAGLGYVAALAGRMSEAVIAVEEQEELADAARETLARQEADNVIVETAPLLAGAPEHGPYDVIVVDGAVEHVPDALSAQLKDNGRMVALFIDGALGQCHLGTKASTGMTWRRAFDATAPVLPGFSREKAFEF